MGNRVQREQEFHDSIYESNARRFVSFLYPLDTLIRRDFRRNLFDDCQNKVILEYGCGLGSAAFDLAKAGARVYGIDISEYAISLARERALSSDLNIEFNVMNAERLTFADETFNLICGTGILHHLDLERAVQEIYRVLKPGGAAVFIEPLAHNPFINMFRRLTPSMRSRDERPLKLEDLRVIELRFPKAQISHYFLLSILSLPFRRMKGLRRLADSFEFVDRFFLNHLPFLRRFAWQILIVATK